MIYRKFIAYGALNTLFGYSVYAIFVYAGIGIIWAVFFSNLLGILFNYATSSRFVFVNTSGNFFRFILLYLTLFLIGLFMVAAIDRVLSNKYISYALTIPVTAVASFVLQRNFVFKNEKN
jgi:putative flippase GtrA